MNAIVFCNLAGMENGTSCLTVLGGEPVLGYILHGLDRLGLTKMIFMVGREAGSIRRFLATRATRGLTQIVTARSKGRPDSLANLAWALHHAESTGIYILNGHCIFGPELLAGLAREDSGAVACLKTNRGDPAEMLIMAKDEYIARIGRDHAPEYPTERAVGLYFLPRTYLAALRGAIVAVTAAGGAEAPIQEAVNFLIQRGLGFRAYRILGQPFAELRRIDDLAQATGIALNIQNGRRKERPLTG